MDQVKSPKVKIKLRRQNQKVFEASKNNGWSDIVSILAANRVDPSDDINAIFKPTIKHINKELPLMKDLDKAAERLAQAVIDGEVIGLCVDFDVDGISSGVVLKKALRDYLSVPEDKIRLHVNNRLEFGYGFNPKALDVILNHDVKNPPTLLITADQGSNDNDQVVAYQKHMIEKGFEIHDVIITDHHEINSVDAGKDAFAFVNPQQESCEFFDQTICGCVVALFLCIRTRLYLQKYYNENEIDKKIPTMAPLISFACMATIADCVSLRSEVNRFIIQYGKEELQKGDIPSFSVIKESISTPETLITTKDIAFSLAPRINADSRTGGDGMTAVSFLMSNTVEEARFYWDKLTTRNNKRKDQEKVMLKEATVQASEQYYRDNRRAFTLYLPEGNHGIHGIVASRIKEKFNCPVIIFSPVDLTSENDGDRLLSASGRSIDGIHINEVLLEMQENGMTFGFGGHKMALGVKKVIVSELQGFGDSFDLGVKAQAKSKGFPDGFFEPSIMVDSVLSDELLPWLRSTEILTELNYLDPYGQKFMDPCFAMNIQVKSFRLLGQNKEHVKIKCRDSSGFTFDAMMFGYDNSPIYNSLLIGGDYTIAVELKYDNFYKKLGMQILTITEGFNNVVQA